MSFTAPLRQGSQVLAIPGQFRRRSCLIAIKFPVMPPVKRDIRRIEQIKQVATASAPRELTGLSDPYRTRAGDIGDWPKLWHWMSFGKMAHHSPNWRG